MKVAAPKPDRKALYEEAVRGNGDEPAAGATTPRKKAAPKADTPADTVAEAAAAAGEGPAAGATTTPAE
jgi:small subunit ribosomal protein S16